MKRALSAALAGALALGAACGDTSSPAPTPGTVTAYVYVDTDNNGTMTTGDVVMDMVDVALLRDGEVVATADVGANGAAVFTDVMPGSYRLQIVGAVPDGMALTGSEAPTAVVPFRGGDVAVDFRWVYYPGSLVGRVFKDVNGDGDYDAGTDEPGAGLEVVLILPLSGGSEARIDSVRTDAEGRYQFPRLAPQEFKVEFEVAGTMEYAGGATKMVTVVPEVPTVLDAIYGGSAVITIAEARALAAGSMAAVQGHVYVKPGTFSFTSSGTAFSEIWVQDSTGGIASIVVTPDAANAVESGDLVELTGPIVVSSGELRIGSTSSPAVLEKLTGTNVVEPVHLTPAEIAAWVNEGELAVVGPVTVTSIQSFSSSFNVNTTLTDGSPFTIRVSNRNLGLAETDFPVGAQFYVAGPFTRFNTTRQVKVRSPGDVVPVQTVATVRASTLGDTVATRGVLTVPPNVFTSGTGGVNSEVWVQDATGGIAVFSIPSSSTLALGDSVDVFGILGAFNDQKQISGSSATIRLVVQPRAGNSPVTARAVTGTEINALAYEGELVTTLVTVDSVATGTTAAFNVWGRTADGQTVTIRAAGGNTGLTRTDFVVGQTYAITGILTQFRGAAQLKPRSDADVVLQ